MPGPPSSSPGTSATSELAGEAFGRAARNERANARRGSRPRRPSCRRRRGRRGRRRGPRRSTGERSRRRGRPDGHDVDVADEEEPAAPGRARPAGHDRQARAGHLLARPVRVGRKAAGSGAIGSTSRRPRRAAPRRSWHELLGAGDARDPRRTSRRRESVRSTAAALDFGRGPRPPRRLSPGSRRADRGRVRQVGPPEPLAPTSPAANSWTSTAGRLEPAPRDAGCRPP